jgi:hypothetical protein
MYSPKVKETLFSPSPKFIFNCAFNTSGSKVGLHYGLKALGLQTVLILQIQSGAGFILN